MIRRIERFTTQAIPAAIVPGLEPRERPQPMRPARPAAKPAGRRPARHGRDTRSRPRV